MRMQSKAIETLVAEGISEFGNGILVMTKSVTLKKSNGSVVDLGIDPNDETKVYVTLDDGRVRTFAHLSFTDRLRLARKVFRHISHITAEK